MPLVVNTNVSSLIAQRNLSTNTNMLNKSLERLSSGYRINRAADDAAGLTISETLRSQIRGINTALQNAQDGISILQITEGTLSVVTDNLQRVRELTVQAANDTNGVAQRDAIESEIKARLFDNQRIVQAANFNGIKLLNGSALLALGSVRLQIGPNADIVENTLDITRALDTASMQMLGMFVDSLNPALGSYSTTWDSISFINFLNNSNARTFLMDIDRALASVSARRSLIGAIQNQLDSAIQNLSLSGENFSASESRIRDLDMAAETANLTKAQILQQASVSILSQANQAPGLVLRLLQ